VLCARSYRRGRPHVMSALGRHVCLLDGRVHEGPQLSQRRDSVSVGAVGAQLARRMREPVSTSGVDVAAVSGLSVGGQ